MKKRGSLLADAKEVARGWRWSHRPLVPKSVELPDVEPHDFPTAWARTSVGRAARTALQAYALKPLIDYEVKPRVEGLDVLQGLRAPVIFIANHSSHLDAPLVLTSLPPAWRDQTATGAAADYFFDVWWRAAATALVFNAFPVERSGGKGRATHLAGKMLNDGWNLLVFPEGTRSKDGWVRDFRMGAARLAVEHAVPVVPVALRGTYQAMPRGAGWPAKGRRPVTVRFGRALRRRDGEAAHEFNQRMRAGLAITLSEDRTTWWDAIRNGKQDAASGPDVARWRRVWEASAPMPVARKAFPQR
ncbi:MAG: 1-acyl-sn-glycerol-3-phosphate acyltransferase [Actinobacteria bacterium]|nr:MAG: 1-acyl-sn-glycerol-3-phosphate acyltransferase [Actinomycetota bacterium]